jgi:alpha-glucosidase
MRRARAAALLSAALPGSLYIYQGDELGLPEYEQLDDELRQDPMYLRSAGLDPGREGCRVPLPWAGDLPPFGFSPPGAQATWLPQPEEWAVLTVATQEAEPGSMLALYRAALRIRRSEPGLGDGPMTWLPSPDGVLAFARDPSFTCVVNLAERPVALPEHTAVLLSSAPLTDAGDLGTDTAAWLRTTPNIPDAATRGRPRRRSDNEVHP